MPPDVGLFLRELARDPQGISAMAPSSPRLARAMAAGLDARSGRIVEFGPGTGVFTRALLANGVPPENLTLFEVNPAFARHLALGFPGVRVVNDGAQTVAAHCAAGVAAVISGLPLLSFPPALCRAIYAGAIAVLSPRGMIRQFTYGPRAPLPDDIRAALGLGVARGRRIWWNLPPARVYTYRPALARDACRAPDEEDAA